MGENQLGGWYRARIEGEKEGGKKRKGKQTEEGEKEEYRGRRERVKRKEEGVDFAKGREIERKGSV